MSTEKFNGIFKNIRDRMWILIYFILYSQKLALWIWETIIVDLLMMEILTIYDQIHFECNMYRTQQSYWEWMRENINHVFIMKSQHPASIFMDLAPHVSKKLLNELFITTLQLTTSEILILMLILHLCCYFLKLICGLIFILTHHNTYYYLNTFFNY